MKRSGASDDRGRRLGIKARGSMEFLLLCMKRGVPPEKISAFLLGLGLDAQTVNRWMDYLRREMAGIPGRAPIANDSPEPVGSAGSRPAGSVPMNLDGKTATDFVLPDLDATKTGHGPPIDHSVIAEEEMDVSLEISEKELRKANHEDSQGYDRVALDAPPVPEGLRIQLEKPSTKKKRRSSKRGDRKLLATPQARLAAFAAVILLTWLLSDAGWFPGGSARQSTMPSPEHLAREEAPRPATPDEAPVAQAEAPQAPITSSGEEAQEAAVQEYPDPWAAPAARSDTGRSPGSSKPPVQRHRNSKKARPSP